jgi:hypothetical protein
MFRLTKASSNIWYAVEIGNVLAEDEVALEDIQSLVDDGMPVLLVDDIDDAYEILGEDNVEILD